MQEEKRIIITSAEGKNVKKTENIGHLTESLLEAYDNLRLGAIDSNTASAHSKLANTIISSCRLQLEALKLRAEWGGEKPKAKDMKFIEGSE